MSVKQRQVCSIGMLPTRAWTVIRHLEVRFRNGKTTIYNTEMGTVRKGDFHPSGQHYFSPRDLRRIATVITKHYNKRKKHGAKKRRSH